ncbi:MAG TPA: hypothetical protein VEI47_02365 [Gemmatimonadales bacterium]|jgi:hypothetical protein|nr:hypothetical protein [Gemmatimonadales bacterium]
MDAGETITAVAGMITGLLVVGGIIWGVVRVFQLRYQSRLSDPGLAGEVSSLRDQVDALQQQLYETQERLDFTERLLTQGRDVREVP